MSCRDTRERLGDYVDGDLAEARRAAVERHLADCVDCRRELEELGALVAAAAELRRDVEPERDLWPAIAARLRSRDRSTTAGPSSVAAGRWWHSPGFRLAAAAALAAAVTLVLARGWGERQPVGAQDPPRAEAAAVAAREMELALASEEARAEDGLLQVREDLLRAIAIRREEIDPATREVVDRNLAIIDRAIGEIHQALEADPRNGELGLLLASAYQREVELLQQITRI